MKTLRKLDHTSDIAFSYLKSYGIGTVFVWGIMVSFVGCVNTAAGGSNKTRKRRSEGIPAPDARYDAIMGRQSGRDGWSRNVISHVPFSVPSWL
jgi:hypothetical protein